MAGFFFLTGGIGEPTHPPPELGIFLIFVLYLYDGDGD
jgi:hypothetical protein